MTNAAVLARSGRKRAIASKIIARAPKDFTTYVEPFVGSGDVYYAMDLQPGTKAVINDLDKGVFMAHKLLKQIKSIPDPYAYDKMGMAEMGAFVNRKQSTPVGKLVRLLQRFSGGFGGNVPADDKDAKLYRNPAPSTKLKRVEGISEYMKNTTVLNQDYKAVIRRYDGAKTFFYLDPPYASTAGKIYNKDSIDYEELATVLKGIKGKFLMSINDSSEMRKLFSSFNMTGLTVKRSNNAVGRGDRKELFVQNY